MKDKETLKYLNEKLEILTKQETKNFENEIISYLEEEFIKFQEGLPLENIENKIINNSKKAFIRLYKNIKNEMDENFNILNKYFYDAIVDILENPLLSIEKLYDVKDEYLEKIKHSFDGLLLKDKISNELSIMIYQYSIENSLHQNASKYNLLKEYILKFEDKINEKSISYFDILNDKINQYINEYFDDWFNDLIDKFNKYKRLNIDSVCSYSCNLLNEKTNMLFLEEVRVSFLNLKRKTIDLKEEIYLKTKKKDMKKVFITLQDYLLSYHNSLSSKIKDLFLEMNDITFLDREDQIKRYQMYHDFVYKFAQVDFNFDKCFSDYENYYINDFSRVKKKDKIHLIINGYKDDIVSLMKEFSLLLLKNYLDILNDILYRNKMVISEVSNYYYLVSKNEIDKLFKNVN